MPAEYAEVRVLGHGGVELAVQEDRVDAGSAEGAADALYLLDQLRGEFGPDEEPGRGFEADPWGEDARLRSVRSLRVPSAMQAHVQILAYRA